MTTLTPEQQIKIEEFAGLFFTPADISLVLGLDQEEFQGPRFEMDDFRVYYQRGKLLKEAEYRKKVFQLAVAGSSPAQMIMKEIIDKSNLNAISV